MSGLPRFDPSDFPGDITLDLVIPAATAEFAQLPAGLRPELVAALGRRGIDRLYSHQAEAYDAVKRGRHPLRGLFGSQVANVIRRLKRICAFYGSHPTFICASATIRNPRELATRLLEEQDIALVDRSGAPRGERRLVFYNPPLLNLDLGVRRSSMLEARRIAAPSIRAGVQTIVFCRSRLAVEVMLSYLRQDLDPRLDSSRRVRGYRAGYLPLHRREIEAGLRNGDITGVVSTNALELGIDIGSLQCAVLVGYPGTIASTWQA